MTQSQLGLGLVGCGGFGLFCMETYAALDGLRPVALADAFKPAADRAAKAYPHLAVHYSAAELVARDDVDIVHIATPPGTHHALGVMAARAGKHVLCEKPLAMTLEEADEMLAAAKEARTIMPVNFVLRHNPITDAVKAIINSGVLGRPLHAAFENYASDENLGPEHWFWDKKTSGGIFIEHGVHFFDLYHHWFGAGSVVAAQTETREGTTQEDRVLCTVRHNDGTVVNHYHGFDQCGRMDRTTHSLLFELGDVTVGGWIPTDLTVHAIVDDNGRATLDRCCRELTAETEVIESYEGDAQVCRSRGCERRVTQKVRIACRASMPKQELYAWSVGALMADQLAYIADARSQRRVTEANGYRALELAVRAADMASDAK